MAPATVLDLVDRLEDVKKAIGKAQGCFGTDWVPNNDVRSQWFDGVFKTLMITQGHLRLFRSHLGEYDWWKTIAPKMHPSNMSWILSEAETQYRWTLLHSTYSQMEECLRRITEAFIPHFMASKPPLFGTPRRRRGKPYHPGIIPHLCEALGLSRYKKLFYLGALIRNTIHNNGYFRPDYGRGRQQVTWRGTTYHLRFGKSLVFLNWDFTAGHIEDLVHAMCAIVTHNGIASLPRIRRMG